MNAVSVLNEDGSDSSVISVIVQLNSHDRLLYNTLFERVTFRLHNDTKTCPNEINSQNYSS